jgi:hypothetical protein
MLNAWFRLVANMHAKYGIQDGDCYNFDETGFMMDTMGARMVLTRSDRINRPKTVELGNREWVTAICAAFPLRCGPIPSCRLVLWQPHSKQLGRQDDSQ